MTSVAATVKVSTSSGAAQRSLGENAPTWTA
jgi:hypothetical protein